jgi:hypothetical protein
MVKGDLTRFARDPLERATVKHTWTKTADFV